ncbi:MAG: chemotaxis protein CheB [Bacteroidales bacterium]|nr:chemotaxis protein CheB [Bacteroidales bacterium]
MNSVPAYQAVVIGASSGGLHALKKMLPAIPRDFPCPILIVQHISPVSENYLTVILDKVSQINIKEADEKEPILAGTAYVAPPDYHLLVEADKTLSFSVEDKVNYSRPSIDVLFQTAADAYNEHLVGILLTGANADGSEGMSYIKKRGGFTIVQDPADAESPVMPKTAIMQQEPDMILTLDGIIEQLLKPGFIFPEKKSHQ